MTTANSNRPNPVRRVAIAAMAVALAALSAAQPRAERIRVTGVVIEETIRIRGGAFTLKTNHGRTYQFTTYGISDEVFGQLDDVKTGTWLTVTGKQTEFKDVFFPLHVTKLAGPPERAAPVAGQGPVIKGRPTEMDVASVRKQYAEFQSAVKNGNVRAIVALFAPGVRLSSIGCRCDTFEGDPVDYAEMMVRMDRDYRDPGSGFACVADGTVRAIDLSSNGEMDFTVNYAGSHFPSCVHVTFRKFSDRWLITAVGWML
jgi:hypothetical protein